ncbi:MAG: DNA repair protein RadC [Parcubacteria group bacterium]|nr:DNA repair protein RadC [Parcubacteria group bacterium]
MTKITEIPKIERPREKLIDRGAQSLKDEELLAVLLGSGVEGKNVIEVSKEILQKYPKAKLLKLSFEELSSIKGIGQAKACSILAAQEFIKRGLAVRDDILPVINSVEDIIAQAIYMREKSREHFMVIYLNGRNEMIYKKPMFVGTLNANLVHPREIFSLAFEKSASSVVFAHNHPSGDPEPSQADLEINKRLVEAGKIMGIDVLDHIVITKGKVYSFKENNLM